MQSMPIWTILAAVGTVELAGWIARLRAGSQEQWNDLNRNPEPVVAPFLALPHLGVGLGVHEARMGVERLEHPRNGPIDEPVGLHLADVHVLDAGHFALDTAADDIAALVRSFLASMVGAN